MRALFSRLQGRRVSPLEAELMAARPEPSARLVDSIVTLVRPRASTRPSKLRLGYAGALTAAMVAVLGATGGLAYAASAVHLTSSPAKHSAPRSAACSQYAVRPRVSGRKPAAGRVGSTVTISGSNFSGASRVTRVTFAGDKKASFHVASDTKLTARVPNGAKTGGITVTNCAGSATSPKFKVIAGKAKKSSHHGAKHHAAKHHAAKHHH